MTYTAIYAYLIINRYSKYSPLRKAQLRDNFKYQEYPYRELSIQNGWYLKNKDLVQKVEKYRTPLEIYITRKSGIATFKNNSIYIFTLVKESANIIIY